MLSHDQPCLQYKLYRFLTVYMSPSRVYEPKPCIWAQAVYMSPSRVYEPKPCIWAQAVYMSPSRVYKPKPCIWAQAVYMSPSRVYEPKPCIWAHIHCQESNDFIILQDDFLPWKFCFVTFPVSIIDLSYPIGAPLYNIGTRIRSQCMMSSSSKCREKIKWQRIFINNGN